MRLLVGIAALFLLVVPAQSWDEADIIPCKPAARRYCKDLNLDRLVDQIKCGYRLIENKAKLEPGCVAVMKKHGLI